MEEFLYIKMVMVYSYMVFFNIFVININKYILLDFFKIIFVLFLLEEYLNGFSYFDV